MLIKIVLALLCCVPSIYAGDKRAEAAAKPASRLPDPKELQRSLLAVAKDHALKPKTSLQIKGRTVYRRGDSIVECNGVQMVSPQGVVRLRPGNLIASEGDILLWNKGFLGSLSELAEKTKKKV